MTHRLESLGTIVNVSESSKLPDAGANVIKTLHGMPRERGSTCHAMVTRSMARGEKQLGSEPFSSQQ